MPLPVRCMLVWFACAGRRAPAQASMGCSGSRPFSNVADDGTTNLNTIIQKAYFRASNAPKVTRPSADTVNDDKLICPSVSGKLAAALRREAHVKAVLDEDLTDPGSATTQRLSLLGTVLSTAAYTSHPLRLLHAVHTCAEAPLASELGRIARTLVNNEYHSHEQGHSRILIGPRGCGKSMALQRFALSASVLFRGLRVVYVDARGVADSAHPLRAQGGDSLVALLWNVLWPQRPVQAAGAAAQPVVLAGSSTAPPPIREVAGAAAASAKPTVQQLAHQLEMDDVWLMVLVDEMERLYEWDNATAVLGVLHEIETLATTKSGRAAFIGCSSSCVMNPLIRGGADLPQQLRDRFPVLQRPDVPDMNSTKLTLWPLPVFPPTYVEAARPFCKPESPDADVRCMLFALGGVARRLHDWHAAPTHAPVAEFNAAAGKMPKHSADFLRAFPRTSDLLSRLYDVTLLLNVSLLHRLAKNRRVAAEHDEENAAWNVDVTKVGSVSWWTEFKPLQRKHVESILRQLHVSEARSVDHSAEDDWMLSFLHYDAALIVLDEHGQVFPWSMGGLLSHLVHRAAQPYSWDDTKKGTEAFMSSLEGSIAKGVIDPSTYRALGSVVAAYVAPRRPG
jgi:hypothetical protein